MSLSLLIKIVKTNYPDLDKKELDLVKKAYLIAERKLKGMKRGSMNYFDHPLESALIIAKMKLGPKTVAATLLHDLPRRANYKIDEIEENFDTEIASIIRSLENLNSIETRYKGTDKYVESAKRMFVVVAKDFRVLLIKFVERLNNLQHLDTFPLAEQKRRIEMAEKIAVPLLGILGIWHLRWQIEDICFKYRQPKIYKKIYSKIEKGLYHRREKIVDEVRDKILKKTKKYKIDCEVSSRFKHVISIYRKMQEKKVRFNEIYDVFAVRIIVNTSEDCYLILGIVHNLWKPVPQRVKDYIAAPKPNGYQSLQTTVFSDEGRPIEFQIRTKKMDDEARYGVAAHWYYKRSYEGQKIPKWIRSVIEARKVYDNSSCLTEKIDLDTLIDSIFCYTPKGDIIELPRDSTSVDFAYLVHTEIGHACKSAIINGIDQPLDTILKNNDVVEIIKKKNKHPLKKWLKFVKTRLAKENINRFYNQKSKIG